jgi:hypothetical protein
MISLSDAELSKLSDGCRRDLPTGTMNLMILTGW